MAEEGLLAGERTWFYDQRSPVRRMGVSSHPDQGVAILSFWQGDRCTATFRLPLHQASALIATLADSMAVAIPAPSPTPPARPAPRPWWVRLRERFRGSGADVVPLRPIR